MAFAESRPDVPTWIPGLVAVLVVASFAYGIVVMGSLSAPVVAWLGVLGVATLLFVVYLLYRLVVAVETIAERV